ncbi:MAG TPA: endolytic transglycosylase MltG [Aggregatilineaceae bacterium]|nr:endolytic transglycosylase MltG [Aggregatilineaceae bacterium]
MAGYSDPNLSRRRGLIAGLFLAGGALAWVIALAAVLIATRDGDASGPETPSTREAERPTLAAATDTALPTERPTTTSTDTATPLPTDMAVPIPSAAAVPDPSSSLEAGGAPTLAAAGVPETASPVPASDTTQAEAACAPPESWERYVVQPDDTLFAFSLGAGGTVSVDDLIAANCLTSRYLLIGQVIYLPPGAAENAPPSLPAGPPSVAGVHGPRTPQCPCPITVGQGWRREQIADAINAAQTLFTGADFLDVTGPGTSAAFDFAMARPPGTSLEGFLFPGTYTAQNDTTAEGFRDMLLSAFAANVSPQMRADAAAQGVTFYQAMIIASIVQREVHGPETQKLVASVYYNRYRDGNGLGTTVAVQYALGGPGNWWPRVTGSGLKVDSPYNTYTHAGLPPTPIDSPGLSAIVAAVYPPHTEYRFHTAACDGSGEAFAVTYEEHLKNVNCQQ